MCRAGMPRLGLAGTAARFELALVLVVMAVQAQELPIAAVGGIVGVIVVAVMDGELSQVGTGELARASAANPRIDLQRLFPVALLARFGTAASIGEDAIQLAWVFPAHRVSVLGLPFAILSKYGRSRHPPPINC